MKKIFYILVFAFITSLTISACSDENIQPADGGGNQGDKCQFGGCVKN